MSPNVSDANDCFNDEISECQTKVDALLSSGTNDILHTELKSDLSAELGVVEKLFHFKTKLIWRNIIAIFTLHILFIYVCLTFPYFSHWKTFLWAVLIGQISGFGVTGGAHRYFTHRSYKANLPLKVILLMSFYAAGQNSVHAWVRDHLVHHKFSETDADPHNSKRGFFFSHVGWLMMRKHPEVIRRGRQIDTSYITNDPVIATAERFYPVLKVLLAFVIPTAIPVLFWNESWYYAFVSQVIGRYTISLNITWSVNSVAHIWGTRPYDKNIKPVENKWVSIATNGEGWHNYHHVFPQDYKAAELGNYRLNLTTALIDAFSYIGWAYDLKEPPRHLVDSVSMKKGDGSHVST